MFARGGGVFNVAFRDLGVGARNDGLALAEKFIKADAADGDVSSLRFYLRGVFRLRERRFDASRNIALVDDVAVAKSF